MNTSEITQTLTTLFGEFVDGTSESESYMLNGGDPGLLSSLDRLSAEEASRTSGGGASVAAHADHIRYGLTLFNRWAAGERNPFQEADWAASWRKGTVSEAGWEELRGGLREEARRWKEALGEPREVDRIALNGIFGSIAHLAYHLGAIRQIDRSTRGPSADAAS